MKANKITAISTTMLAFSTFLGVLLALMSYLSNFLGATSYQIFLYGIIYIDSNILFLYILKRKGVFNE